MFVCTEGEQVEQCDATASPSETGDSDVDPKYLLSDDSYSCTSDNNSSSLHEVSTSALNKTQNVFTTVKSQQSSASKTKPERDIDYLNTSKYHIIGHQNVYCAQKQNTFQTVQQKFVLCTKTEHIPGGTSEIFTVHRKTTHSRRYNRNVYCVHKQNTFQTVHQKCLLCTETKHIPDGTYQAVITDHKTL